MNNPKDLGASFESLKAFMKENWEPSDNLGMTFEGWKERVWTIIINRPQTQIWTTDSELRKMFDQGISPYVAYQKLIKDSFK